MAQGSKLLKAAIEALMKEISGVGLSQGEELAVARLKACLDDYQKLEARYQEAKKKIITLQAQIEIEEQERAVL